MTSKHEKSPAVGSEWKRDVRPSPGFDQSPEQLMEQSAIAREAIFQYLHEASPRGVKEYDLYLAVRKIVEEQTQRPYTWPVYEAEIFWLCGGPRHV